MTKTRARRYSWLQYCLWLIAGSEIGILRNCPTDYNRHAGIGFTLLMTALFALFAGTYAGWYFSQNGFGAAMFGLIWAMLVFSIDRTMVTSLKKKPGAPDWQSLAVQLGMRIILGGLIAFIISIPIELLVFRDNIDGNMRDYKNTQLAKLREGGTRAFGVREDSLAESKANAEAAAAFKASESDPRTTEFVSKKGEYNAAITRTANAEKTFHAAEGRRDAAYSHLLRNAQGERIRTPAYNHLRDAANAAQKNWTSEKRTMTGIGNELSQMREAWRKLQTARQETAEGRREEAKKELDTSGKKIGAQIAEAELFQTRMDHSFVIRFDVLGYLANKRDAKGHLENGTILLFLWLIRVLFFVIELLPSIVKLATPLGMYDYAVYQAEQDFVTINLAQASRLRKQSAEDRVSKELAERSRQLDKRLEEKGKMHDRLVAEALRHQGEVAEGLMKDWRRRQDKKLNS